MKRETKEEIILATKKACATALYFEGRSLKRSGYGTSISPDKAVEICMNVPDKDIKVISMKIVKKQEEECEKHFKKLEEKQSKCLHKKYTCIDHDMGWDTMECDSCGKTWGKSSSSYNQDY